MGSVSLLDHRSFLSFAGDFHILQVNQSACFLPAAVYRSSVNYFCSRSHYK